MPKIVKGTLWDLLTTILIQIIKKLKGDTLVQSKNSQKKSHSAEKIEVKNTKIAKGDP